MVLFFVLSVASSVTAAPADLKAEMNKQLGAAAGASSLGEAKDPRQVIVDVIKIALSLIGTVFLVLVVYSGVLWMTAGGNEESVGKAKKLLFQGVIGLIIVLSAYGITQFIIYIARAQPGNYDNTLLITPKPYKPCNEITGIGC